MGFILKKVAGLLVQPLSVVILLLLVGCFLLWRGRRERLARVLVTCGTLLLLLISFQLLPSGVGRLLEAQYDTYAPTDVDPAYVVVLGGGVRDDPTLPLSARLSPVALARLVEGVRVAQLHPDARLIVSGGNVFSAVAEARVAAEVARMLGVENDRIIVEDASLDTHEQAIRVAEIVGDRTTVVVTSATHMPRSMRIFRKQGVNAVAAPTAHLFRPQASAGPRAYLPTAEHLYAFEIVMHEVFGLAWAWVNGMV